LHFIDRQVDILKAAFGKRMGEVKEDDRSDVAFLCFVFLI